MNNQEYNIGEVKGDVVGSGASGITAKAIHGNVLQVIIQSEDITRQLGELNELPSEVKQNQAAGMEGSKISRNSVLLQETISQLLEVIRSSNRKGRNVDKVQAGELHLSQVDLLLKKAILLKSDADQMYFDQLGENTPAGMTTQGTVSLDMNTILAGFDENAYISKLREAYKLLEEAIEIDPANTEVLLHMAQLLIELTPDDPTDEQKLLYRIQKLLGNPKDDSERFRLAQATFLLATTGDHVHMEMLGDARRMFKKLGRNEWVRQCNELMNQHVNRMNTGTQQSGFHPAGSWNIRVADYLGSTMQLIIHPNGYFEAIQQAGVYGAVVQASGQWVYVPAQQMLQLQGFVNGFQPFMLGIMIQYQQGNIFYGVGTDSYSYTLQKM